MLSLDTELTSGGQKLTLDGKYAGMIYVHSLSDGTMSYRYSPPFGQDFSPVRSCLIAAQYDALAWNEDRQAAMEIKRKLDEYAAKQFDNDAIYYTLAVFEDNQWAIAFGDFDLDCVIGEKDDCVDNDISTTIFKTDGSQRAIDNKITAMNKNLDK